MRVESLKGLVKRRLMVGAAMALASVGAHAAEYTIDRSLALRQEYNDNYNFRPQNKNGVWLTSLNPYGRIQRSTEVSSLSLYGYLGLVKLIGDTTPKSRLDASAGSLWTYRFERSSLGLDARYVRDSAFATELGTTGVALRRVQRNLYSITPTYSYTLSERWTASANLNASRSRYASSSPGLFDYNSESASGSMSYQYDAKTAIIGSISGSRFETDPTAQSSRSGSASIGIDYRYSQRLTANGSIGYFRSHNKFNGTALFCRLPGSSENINPILCDPNFLPGTPAMFVPVSQSSESTSSGTTYSAGLQWAINPTTNLGFNARQGLNPSGIGSVVKTTSGGLVLSHQFSELLSGSIDAQAARSQVLQSTFGNSDSRYYSAGGSLSWRLTREWVVEGGYRHSRIEYSSASTKADSNMIFALVRYDWPRMSISR